MDTETLVPYCGTEVMRAIQGRMRKCVRCSSNGVVFGDPGYCGQCLDELGEQDVGLRQDDKEEESAKASDV